MCLNVTELAAILMCVIRLSIAGCLRQNIVLVSWGSCVCPYLGLHHWGCLSKELSYECRAAEDHHSRSSWCLSVTPSDDSTLRVWPNTVWEFFTFNHICAHTCTFHITSWHWICCSTLLRFAWPGFISPACICNSDTVSKWPQSEFGLSVLQFLVTYQPRHTPIHITHIPSAGRSMYCMYKRAPILSYAMW